MIDLSFISPEGKALPTKIQSLVIAGWAGRDETAVHHHIEELKALGVKPPSQVPLFYRASSETLTQGETLDFLGDQSSGEVEAFIVARDDGLYVGVGSDHTDREVEAYSVAVSKQMCLKPVSRTLWRFDDVIGHWDRLEMRSWATIAGVRVLYQEGAMTALRNPRNLMDRFSNGPLPVGTAMLCGTFGAIGGIRPAERFEMELNDPVLKRTIRHSYSIGPMPVVS